MKSNATKENKRSIEHLIELLLCEKKILEKVTADFAPHKYECNSVLIIRDTGKIRFGRYNWNGFGGFWNNLIKCYEEVSFSDFFIKTWDALVEMTVGTESHEAVLEGLSRETLLRGIRNKEYDWIVDRFFDVCRHLSKEGYWNPFGTKAHLPGGQGSNDRTVEIEVGRQVKPGVQFRVVDSVGETFEILNARWIGGRK